MSGYTVRCIVTMPDGTAIETAASGGEPDVKRVEIDGVAYDMIRIAVVVPAARYIDATADAADSALAAYDEATR